MSAVIVFFTWPRKRNIDKDASSNDRGRTHLSIKVELALCLQPLWIALYNCQGWTSGSRYVYDLLPEYDILCLQKHWLLQEHLDSLSTVKECDFLYTAVSGVDSSQLLYGRPYGGCAILYRKSLTSAVLIGPKSPSCRFCCLKLTLIDHKTVLLVCVYTFLLIMEMTLVSRIWSTLWVNSWIYTDKSYWRADDCWWFYCWL